MYNKKMWCIFLLLGLFSSAKLLAQTNYYVSTTGNDANDGLSVGHEKLTVQAAINAASSGDIVNIADGVYSPVSGVPGNFITVNKSLKLKGQSMLGTIIDGTIVNYVTANNYGINISASNVTIQDLTVRSFESGVGNTIDASQINITNVSSSENYRYGYYSNRSVTGLNILSSTFNRNGNKGGVPVGSSARGIMLQSTAANHIDVMISQCTVNENQLVGIDFAGSQLTDGITISGNVVNGNGDSGIGVWLGKNSVNSKPVLIDANEITMGLNQRFGIEIKNAVGTGMSSGMGSIVLTNNVLSQPGTPTNSRDFAAIAVIRRKDNYNTINDQNFGVYISGNVIDNIKGSAGAEGDGYGIVLGGTGHTVIGNTIANTEIGIQMQSGNLNFNNDNNSPSNSGDANTYYFDRDNSADACALMVANALTDNGVDYRYVTGAATSVITAPDLIARNLTTGVQFCTLQASVNAPSTNNGDIVDVFAGTHTLSDAVKVTKGITLRGNDNILSSKPIIKGVGNSINKALIEISAPNVVINNFELQLAQTGNAMIGISTGSSDNFNNLEISDNLIKGMKTFTGGLEWNSYAMKLGRSGNDGSTADNNVSVLRNDVTYDNPLAPELFGRGIYAYNVYGKIGGSVSEANKLLAYYALQGGEIGNNSSSADSFDFSYNQVWGGLVSVISGAPGTHYIKNNSIGDAVTSLASANQLTRSLEVKGFRTANANLQIESNQIKNFSTIGTFIQRSNNVTLANNVFTPFAAAGNTQFQSVVFSSKEGTSSSQSAATSNNLTIVGNTFNGNANNVAGTGVAFYNHNAAVNVAPISNAQIGGVGALKNTFSGSLAAYIVLDGTTSGTTTGATFSQMYDVAQGASNTTHILPFNGNVNASFNSFGAINTETESNFDNLVAVKDKITDGVDNGVSGYVNIQTDKAFVPSAAVLPNALATVPDNFTLSIKNDNTVHGNLGNATVTKSHTFAIDGNNSANLVFEDLTVNGVAKTITFQNAAQVNNNFTLTAGKIVASNVLNIDASKIISTTLGADNFVDGQITVANVNGDVLLPVGKTKASYLKLTNVTNGPSTFTLDYMPSAATNLNNKVASIDEVLDKEYWGLVRNSGAVEAKVSLYSYDATASGLTTDMADATKAWYDGAEWKNQGNFMNGNTPFFVDAAVTNNAYGLFTFGTLPSTLPVSLVNFDAKTTSQGAQLSWTTSSEKDAAVFEIEKSFDGQHFSVIQSVVAKGTASVYQILDRTFSQSAYYRLVQRDNNGDKVVYSQLVKFVKGFADRAEVLLYPNPATNIIYVALPLQMENAKGQVFNAAGKALQAVILRNGNLNQIDVSGLAIGVYFLKIDGQAKALKFVIK